ncbi:alpha/beta fold hydrolase [Streptomyces sp. NPDC056296]|uniref:alpha/beta fold hydrolase n=1 Tax=Streptomyces sp. NPDC056296 TaxID=3345775 RepID=UPI0035DF1109
MTDTQSRNEGWATREGRRLHWTVTGSGEHTVLLEAGIGASSSAWRLVEEPLTAFARVLTYDRAGYGTATVKSTSVEDALLDLETVLEQSATTGPLVLVGHSWGGVLMRLFCARHPERAAALLLVDATHEGMSIMRSPAFNLALKIAARVQALKARSGALRRSLEAGRGELGRTLTTLPPALREELLDELSTPATWHQSAHELRCVPLSLRSLPTETPHDIPVIAVIGTQAVGGAERRARAAIRTAYETWLPTVPHGRLLQAPHSGHVVPLQEPELLVRTLRDLLATPPGDAGS